jgi:WD40 repeat protein
LTINIHNKITKYLKAPVVFLLLVITMSTEAQFYNGYQMEFGRSRVQFEEFFWSYYKFERFDTYFYLNGRELAVHTAKYANQQLEIYESRLNTYLEGRIQFIVFNNLNDLKQSNIGLTSGSEYNIGGVSHILGNKVVLYFDGSMVDFQRQIRHGIAHVLLQNAIFGSNLGSQVMNSFLQNLPEWFTIGLISYLADDWNTSIDNRIRNAITSERYKNFSRMVMDENMVKDAGHSFWWFIDREYGSNNIISIINMIRVSRSLETGFQYVLGVKPKTLYKEWFDYYSKQTLETDVDRELPDSNRRIAGKRILKRNSYDRKYSQLKVSPDADRIAFVTNETGKYKVWIHDLQTEKIRKIHTGGYKLDEKIDYSYPLLAWHPSGELLTMIIESKGLIQIHFYDVSEREWTIQNLFGFDKILDVSYSPDGRSLLFSAVQKGQNDIFLFTVSSGSYEKITNDIYDDLSPSFLNGTKQIIFSSNRLSDTLKFGENDLPKNLSKTYDLFIYEYSKKDPLLKRVTNTPFASEIQPLPYGQGHFVYLSDENGIFNTYVGKMDSAIAFVDTTVHFRYFARTSPVSNNSRNIQEHDIAQFAAYRVKIVNLNLLDELFIESLMPASELEPTNLAPTAFMKGNSEEQSYPASLLDILSDGQSVESVGEIEGRSGQRKSFRNVKVDETDNSPHANDTIRDNEIDIENYRLSNQGTINISMPDSLVGLNEKPAGPLQKESSGLEIPKQLVYYTQYSINELVSQIDFSYLSQMYQPYPGALESGGDGIFTGFGSQQNFNDPGLSPTFKAGVTDLMEDYRIMGGVRIGLDLINKEYFINYANLKKRLDKEIIFQRRTFEQPIVSAYVTRQNTNEAFYVLTYPLNRVFRLKTTILFRNENYSFAGPDEFALRYPDMTNNWSGSKIQLIYDDTKELGLNLHEGSRFMIFGEYNLLIEDIKRNLMVVGFDFRNYLRLHKQFVWANRFAGSSNFGTDRLLYYMGGVDSWMLPAFDQETRTDPDQNWTYQALATNMRGFNQNARNGNNFVVLNSEFRLPVFRYLFNRPLKSEFMKSFQLVAFGDAGMAWAGWNPYDEDNVLFTKFENSGPLRIKVQYEKDPLIAGIGFGARAKIFGYFLKGDLAWGIEDGQIKKNPKFYLSMSLDF